MIHTNIYQQIVTYRTDMCHSSDKTGVETESSKESSLEDGLLSKGFPPQPPPRHRTNSEGPSTPIGMGSAENGVVSEINVMNNLYINI